MEKIKKGDIVECVVTGIAPYGIFVDINHKFVGLIHISEISDKYINDINKFVSIGNIIYAKVLSSNLSKKQISLSIKNFNYRNKHSKIEETKHGFSTLKERLPYWIEESYKKN